MFISDKIINKFMNITTKLIKKDPDLCVLGYNVSPTDSKKVMRISVFISEKDYDHKEDKLRMGTRIGNLFG